MNSSNLKNSFRETPKKRFKKSKKNLKNTFLTNTMTNRSMKRRKLSGRQWFCLSSKPTIKLKILKKNTLISVSKIDIKTMRRGPISPSLNSSISRKNSTSCQKFRKLFMKTRKNQLRLKTIKIFSNL